MKQKFLKGVVVNLDDPSVSELMGNIGFDFVWLDAEHGPYHNIGIQNHIIAAKAGGCLSFVRIACNDPNLVKPVLEMGPDAVIFPMINSKADAEAAVKSTLYPPEGIRGFGPRRANRYGKDTGYLLNYKERTKRILQIEHKTAVQNLDEILQVPYIDGILVGPFDLSASLGKIGQVRDPELLEIYDKIARKVREKGIMLGAFAVDSESVGEWINRGADFLALASDTGLIQGGAAGILERFE